MLFCFSKLLSQFVLCWKPSPPSGKVSRSGVNFPPWSEADLEVGGKEVYIVEGGEIVGTAATIDVEDERIVTTSRNRPSKPKYFLCQFNPFKLQNRLYEYEP
jgi:hypothetical protein